jgi:UDP-N-acetylmuramoylalanine--D-glutamate ligase
MNKYLMDKLQGRKVLVLGFGREGRSTFKLLNKLIPDLVMGIADFDESIADDQLLKDFPKNMLFLGRNYLSAIDMFDLIIKSPGVPLNGIDISDNVELSSQSSLFIGFYRNQIVGVSGTKGKSTTSSLIHFLLTKNKIKSILIGNIGKPAFDSLQIIDNETIIVYEMSAHQLEYVCTSPKVAVLLNVFPEHLDYFSSFETYEQAKFNIFKYQKTGDTIICVDWLKNKIKVDSVQLGFGTRKKANKAYLDKDSLLIESRGELYSYNGNSLKIIGVHNRLNALAAVLAVTKLGIAVENALRYLGDFNGLAHRLEFIGEHLGMKFYNDSISTVPQSAIEAVRTLRPVDILILGGFDRGLDYTDLADFLLKSDIGTIIFQGKAGDIIYNLLVDRGFDKSRLFKPVNMETAFDIISERSVRGGICLLSPAAASYDQYRNFEHRGDIFSNLARTLKN